MFRFTALALTLCLPAVGHAQSKAEDCAMQGQIMAAVQQARMDRVKEAEVEAHLRASGLDLPEKYFKMVPLVAPFVYEQKKRDLRKQDLGQTWRDACMAQ